MPELRKDAARNRERILEAARAVRARGDLLALNAVARQADVGVGTVYRHFATVTELEETLVWDRFDELGALLAGATPERFADVLTAHVRLLVEDPLFETVTARPEAALSRTGEVRDALIARLAALIGRAQAERYLRADADAPAVLSLACGLAHAIRSAGGGSDGPLATLLLDVALDGLRPASAARPRGRDSVGGVG